VSKPIPSARAAIKAKCLQCLDAKTGRGAFDCIGRSCPLYPAMPFRGRKLADQTEDPVFDAKIKELAAEIPRRQPSRTLVRKMCAACNPDREHCTSQTCPLLSLTQLQPGGQPRRARTEKQREADIRAASRLRSQASADAV